MIDPNLYSKAVEQAEDYSRRLQILESKLPAYADTGERFVPGVDECWVVAKTDFGRYISANVIPYNRSEPGDAPHWGFFEGMYRSYKAARAEADRLNGENK